MPCCYNCYDTFLSLFFDFPTIFYSKISGILEIFGTFVFYHEVTLSSIEKASFS